MKTSVSSGKISWKTGTFAFGPGGPKLTLDGRVEKLRFGGAPGPQQKRTAAWRGAKVELTQVFAQETKNRVRVTSVLRNQSAMPVVVNHVTLFECARLVLGPQPDDVRILEQSAYMGRVRTPRQMVTGTDGLKALDGTMGGFVSQTHTVIYNPVARSGLLIGFETVDRWLPNLTGRMTSGAGQLISGADNVDGGGTSGIKPDPQQPAKPVKVPAFRRFKIDFDGGDYALGPGETLALGDFVLEAGDDPQALLDAHGDRIRSRNNFAAPPPPLANWCSWYPYRLGVSEQNVLATARAARARHLEQLGLRFLQVDLGWEKDNIPTFFEENERFSRGLGWLSGELKKESFELGLWVGVLCVADTHPIAKAHPEWLLRGADGKPHVNYHWFWEPFCPVYSLDVSHPGAQAWLKKNFTNVILLLATAPCPVLKEA